MQFIDCVEVYRDDLESEAMAAECIESTLRVMWEAAYKADSDLSNDLGNMCWMLMQDMDRHVMTLRRAVEGELTGPKMPKAGGVA